MENSDEKQNLIRQYLLGELDEGQRNTIEELLIIDRQYLEETLAVESELFDDYVNDDLSESDQKKFVEHLLSTSIQLKKLQFAKALINTGIEAAANSPPAIGKVYQTEKWWIPASKKSALSFSIAAVIIVVLAASFIIYIIFNQHKSLERELAELNSEERQRYEDIPNTLIAGPLQPWIVRESGEMKRVFIPIGTEIVQLRLDILVNAYQSYLVVLQTGEGQVIFTLSGLKPGDIKGDAVVLINIPGRILTSGDYQVELSGINADGQLERVGRYTFRVVANHSPDK